MFAPKGSDGIDQKVCENQGRHDEDCDRCVRLRDIFLGDACDARYEKGVYRRNLVVEHVFDAFWGMEYEDSWPERKGGVSPIGPRRIIGPRGPPKQNAVT